MKLLQPFLFAGGLTAAAGARASVGADAAALRGGGRERRQALVCPGGGTCSGHGECEAATGVCWCDNGFGGHDCASEVPLYVDIAASVPPEMQDMLGRFKLNPMYLMETVNNSNIKFIHYSPISAGWAVTKLESSCADDVCFFAYGSNPHTANQTDPSVPPTSGYVYGGPNYHGYFAQLVFDDSEFNPALKKGYHMSIKYRMDPHALADDLRNLDEFNARYVLQPRYVHELSGKYSMFPVDFQQHRTWVITGLLGEPRKERIIMTVTDPSSNRYMPPKGPWQPAEYGVQVTQVCANHVGDTACQHLEPKCHTEDSDKAWIDACCRWTCRQCQIPRTACKLPHTNNVQTLLALASNTSVKH